MGKRLALLAIRLLVSVKPSVCRHLSQVCRGARFGGPVHADVASGPRVGISAGIPARIRGIRDVGGGSAPDPKTARLGAGLTAVWMSTVVLSHIVVWGYGWFLCRCSHGAGASCHLCLAGAQSLPLACTQKCGDDGSLTNAQRLSGVKGSLNFGT